jgi:hypothetical protein
MDKISAILIHHGKEYPKLVWERLTLGFFDEIIVENECPHIYRRYELARKAANEIIYVQDSDCLVNYQVLFSKYDGRITNTMTLPFQQKYESTGCTLVGWGAYFSRDKISVFDKYIERYGMDDHLYREADRIFTYLNKPFNTIIQPHEDLFQNEERMSSPNNIEFHFASATEALRKCSLL